MTGQELIEHVQELAEDLGVLVWTCLTCPEGCYGEARYNADTDERMVVLTELPDTPAAYMVALHELGHHADPRRWGTGLQLDREEFAWHWAVEHMRLLSTCSAAWEIIIESLVSYANDRRYKQTDAFLELMAEAVHSLDAARAS